MTDSKQKPESIKDDEVMITSSISDLEKMLENADKRTDSKFERMFLPALAVFSAIIMGFFIVIYSITSDMTRLANSMDPNMGGNMSSMTESIETLSKNVNQMTVSVAQMQKSFSKVDKNMEEMNKNMTTMQDSMQWMQRDLNMLRSSFSKPLRIFNKIPML